MKKLFKKASAAIRKAVCHGYCAVMCAVTRLTSSARPALAGNRGEGYVDTAVKILMAVVIGALVLAGLYALFGDTVMPTLTKRIKEMFDYAG